MTALSFLAASLSWADPAPYYDAAVLAPAARSLEASAAQPVARVASLDAQFGVPSLLLAQRAVEPLANSPALATPEMAARFWLGQQAARYGLTAAALEAARVVQIHDLGRGGIIVVLRQRIGGVELYRSDVKVLLDRDLGLLAIGGHLHPAASSAGKGTGFVTDEPAAVAAALRDLYGAAVQPTALVREGRAQGPYGFYDLGPAADGLGLRFVEPARVKPVFYALPQRLVPAYFVELLVQTRAGTDAYDYVLSAVDGALLHRENLTHRAVFQYRAFAEATGDHRPFDGPIADFTPHPTGVPDGSYPANVSANLISIDGFNALHDPWLAAGATQTQGNNVDAFTDDNAPPGFSSGDLRAATSTPGVFDYQYDFSLDPQASSTQRMAAVTDLFYVTNWLHDWWYDSGFDEAAGVAQASNYGRGGLEGDRMQAEAQAGAPSLRNNSDMAASVDGASPRMRMFVWDGVSAASLTVQPGNVAPAVGYADFGPASFNVAARLVLAADGTAPTSDACQPLVNGAAVAGKVVLLDRGLCSFKAKVANAQAAGAVGVVLADNVAEAAPRLADDPAVTTVISIPVLSVSQTDGAALKTQAQSGTATATLSRAVTVSRDGTLDNSIIAHEWGHYLHLRQVDCGSAQCSAESEGWGDTNALLMSVRAGDNLNGTWALGQYAGASDNNNPAYFGLRRYPYSTDFTRSPLTFRHIALGEPLPAGVVMNDALQGSDNSEGHNAGEVWAAMLFEGYMALLKDAQGPSPRYSFDQARRRMTDYLEGGLKLAPGSPTYTEQRDAILAVASAADTQDARLLAEAFARRGAGTCAVSPPRNSTDLVGVVEDFSVQPLISVSRAQFDDSLTSCDHDGVLDAAEVGLLTVDLANGGQVDWDGTVTVSSTAGVSFPAGAQAQLHVAASGQATAQFQVALDPAVVGAQVVPFALGMSAAFACDGGASLALALEANADIQPSATDQVETPSTRWTLLGQDAALVWSRQETAPGQHAWRGLDEGSITDTSLVSPPLQVSATAALVLTFDTRYQFETSTGVFWDGAVLEVSTDNGSSWVDASNYGSPGYGGVIGDPQANNALRGRNGYVNHNASYPARDTLTVDLGHGLAGQTVLLRFRIGSDDAQGDFGIELDNLQVAGLTHPPFDSYVPNAATCPPDAGPPDAGPPLVDAGPLDAGPTPVDSGSADAGTTDAGAADAGGPDAGPVDAGLPDAGPQRVDAGPPDAGEPVDAGPGLDAGATDAGRPLDGGLPTDAGLSDAGAADAGSADAGSADAGAEDAGAADAGAPDAGPPATDAGAPDAGRALPDAGLADAGAGDAGAPGAPAHAGGCGCGASDPGDGAGLALLLCLLAARRRRLA
jgi:hypothetical protein